MPGVCRYLAIDEIAAAAWFTWAAMPAAADPLAGLPHGHVRPYRVDDAGDLMAGHDRVWQGRRSCAEPDADAVHDVGSLTLSPTDCGRGREQRKHAERKPLLVAVE